MPDAAVADDWDAHWSAFAAAAQENPAQRYRHRRIAEILEECGGPRRLLDLGSGQGDFLRLAAGRFPEAMLVGIELSSAGNAVAREKVPAARIESIDVSDPAAVPDALRGWATHLACSEVLEHVDDDIALLASARRIMAPGCRVVITVPGGRMSAFDRHIGHRRHYDVARLRDTVVRAGLRPERIERAGFPVFNVYRLMVMLRGDRLAADVTAGPQGKGTARVARVVMHLLQPLFRMNRDDCRWGWQMVAVATNPPD